jgi:hypothetical protein
LPADYHLATLDDFHIKGVKRMGLKFLIRWVEREFYEVRYVTTQVTSQYLKLFIDDQRVFIKHPS